jgi:AraC-like DNA-binding protein
VVLPRPVVAGARQQPLLSGILPTDVGFFPHAKGHLRERRQGVDQAIFIFCTGGSGWCEITGQCHRIQAGDLLVIPPAVPHVYGADPAQPWSIYWFHGQGTLLPAFLNELQVSPDQPVVRIGEAAQVRALFEETLEAVTHGYTKPQLLCASQTMAHLVAVLIREHRQANHEPPSTRQKITRTLDYMKQHLNQSLCLEGLAALANLSRSRFVELFKQQCGYAPIDYFIRLRMQRACRLLDTTPDSVKSIASALGYDDPLYFSRLFRRVNQLSPTDYRRLSKG